MLKMLNNFLISDLQSEIEIAALLWLQLDEAFCMWYLVELWEFWDEHTPRLSESMSNVRKIRLVDIGGIDFPIIKFP